MGLHIINEIDGFQCVRSFVTEEQWYELLGDVSDKTLDVLSCFLQLPNGRGSVVDIEEMFGIKWQSANIIITMLGKKAHDELYPNVEIQYPDGRWGGNKRWPFAMDRGRMENKFFVYELRPELYRAAKRYLNDINWTYVKPLRPLVSDNNPDLIDDPNNDC